MIEWEEDQYWNPDVKRRLQIYNIHKRIVDSLAKGQSVGHFTQIPRSSMSRRMAFECLKHEQHREPAKTARS